MIRQRKQSDWCMPPLLLARRANIALVAEESHAAAGGSGKLYVCDPQLFQD